ncbi:hypothetical protein H1P_3110005 [Hyella patelloides LEGE 07179]|uniref:Uncharacterized protein n=1 Tax=Hyella patelloides LEGE 07179 TaxID=945734 RepID=A0A563VUL5_9CYAN|nr:hypothetical protein H1P_3110005 [Hyella patelloides LEGE 07179]
MIIRIGVHPIYSVFCNIYVTRLVPANRGTKKDEFGNSPLVYVENYDTSLLKMRIAAHLRHEVP